MFLNLKINVVNEMSIQKVIVTTAKIMLSVLNWRPRINIAWTARIGIDNGNKIEKYDSRANAVLSNGQKRPKIIKKILLNE